jgi:hypothetical protein
MRLFWVVSWVSLVALSGLYIFSFSSVPSDKKPSVLVIGSAGFIGYHLTSYLAAEQIDVLAIDKFSSSLYSAPIKYQRAWDLLISHQVDVKHRDVCGDDDDGRYLGELLNSRPFSHVVFLGLGDSLFIARKQQSSPASLSSHDYGDKASVGSEGIQCLERIFKGMRKVGRGQMRPRLVYFFPTKADCEVEVGRSSCHLEAFNERVVSVASMHKSTYNIPSTGVHLPDETMLLGAWLRTDRDSRALTLNRILKRQVSITSLSEREKNDRLNITFIDTIIETVSRTCSSQQSLENDVLKISTEPHALSIQTLWNAINLSIVTAGMTNGGMSALRSLAAWYRSHGHNSSVSLPCASDCSSQRDCLSSGFDDAASLSRIVTTGCQVVYYTVAFHKAQYTLRPVENVSVLHQQHCHVAFVKRESPLGQHGQHLHKGWFVVTVESKGLDIFGVARRVSRIPKISPGKFFANSVKYAVYFDTTHAPVIKPEIIPTLMTVKNMRLAVGMHMHPKMMTDVNGARNRRESLSPMEEIDAIFEAANTAEPEKISRQFRAYQLATDLSGGKLLYNVAPTGWMIVHDLHSVHGKHFTCEWLNEYFIWADRDQPPLYYTVAKRAMDENRINNKVRYRHGSVAVVPIGGVGDGQEYFGLFDRTPGVPSYLPYFLVGNEEDKGYNMTTSINSRNIG